MIKADTICALSTPVGEGGIGIVRLSGSSSVGIGGKIFRAKDGVPLRKLGSHRIAYGHIFERDEIIDEVLVTVMRRPRTYTREDVVEINCHGGIAAVRKVLELTISKGARLAEPGEFTKRAFLNGRIDLVQAEAVLDIIKAKTEKSMSVAMSHLEGVFSSKVGGLVTNIASLMSEVEVGIDFPDEELALVSLSKLSELRERIGLTITGLVRLRQTSDVGLFFREGVNVCVAGSPNVGKSTLFNRLLNSDRSIVTRLSGTTTDVISETIDVDGIPVKLSDTAGIVRRPSGLIEREGVERSIRSFHNADIVIVVIDGSRPLGSDDMNILRDAGVKASVVALNKSDVALVTGVREVEKIYGKDGVLTISALHGNGIEKIRQRIAEHVWGGRVSSAEEVLVTNMRHVRALEDAEQALNSAGSGLGRFGIEVIAYELRCAYNILSGVIGRGTDGEILDEIFSKFCIGK